MYKKYVKSLLDKIFSLILIIILFPIAVITGLICLLFNKGIFFTQTRIGKDKKPFTIYKFKSLNDKPGTNYERSNPVTRFIRTAGLDELPQLINVLKGDMSLIGNRPYLPREKVDMGEDYTEIVKTKPGITGYWQVNGRSDVDFNSRLKMESFYSKNACLKMDLKIFLMTFGAVLLSKGSK